MKRSQVTPGNNEWWLDQPSSLLKVWCGERCRRCGRHLQQSGGRGKEWSMAVVEMG